MMKPVKGLIIILMALAVVFTLGQPALAALGSQGGAGEGDSIEVVKDAPGTKYIGPLTTYVIDNPEYVSNVETPDETPYLIYFFLRLKKGETLIAFSGTAGLTDKFDIPQMQAALTAFAADTVIPILYHDYAPNYPQFWLKKVDNIAEDELALPGYPDCCNDLNGFPMQISIMDITIAVQD